MAGDLPKVYRDILRAAVAPIYWISPGADGSLIVHANGTMTFVRTASQLFGVTAFHVLAEHRRVVDHSTRCFLGDHPFEFDVIDENELLDLATVRLSPSLRTIFGRGIVPLSLGEPGEIVQEGRGIMMCGYPGSERRVTNEPAIDWGLFTALGVARHVAPDQISWKPNPAYHVPQRGLPELPRNQDLGGISGGPLVALFERAGGLLSYHRLAGIVVQAHAGLELVVARRTDSIRTDGSIGRL